MLSCLDYVIDVLNLKILGISDLTIYIDASCDMSTTIWESLKEKFGEKDDVIFNIISDIKNEKVLTQSILDKSIVAYTNKQLGRTQMRLFNSNLIPDSDIRDLMEEWNDFPTVNFGRIEIILMRKKFLTSWLNIKSFGKTISIGMLHR